MQLAKSHPFVAASPRLLLTLSHCSTRKMTAHGEFVYQEVKYVCLPSPLPSWLDLSNASEMQLQQLSQACKPATFGVNSKDVFDENYRKAFKLDTTDFATKFDLRESGLMKTIHSELLEGHVATKPVDAELYKLNVYGKWHR